MENANKIDFHKILQQGSYQHGVICTFCFDPVFFEDYCLVKLDLLKNNSNLTVIADRGTYESVILGPASERPKQANLRYLFHPVSVKGVFHPKLLLFAGKNKGKLIIGSANLTRSGITSNAEMIGCYEFEREQHEEFRPLFLQAFSFLVDLSRRWHSEALSSNLQEIINDAEWLGGNGDVGDTGSYQLLHNLSYPLWRQIASKITAPVDEICILSRFFDSQPSALNRIYDNLHPKRIKLYTQNGITTLTSDWLKHSLVKKGIVDILLCTYMDEDRLQPLHAKAFAIKFGDQALVAYGSANFTTPAMFENADRGNVEILLSLHNVDVKKINISNYFDPYGTATHLRNESELQTFHQDREGERENHDIVLTEATLINEKIKVAMRIPDNLSYDQLAARVICQENTFKSIKISPVDDQYMGIVTERMHTCLDGSSAVIQVEAFRADVKIADSNFVLVTNLKDISTGHSARNDRNIKQAIKNTSLFLTALNDLIVQGDDEALKSFLLTCDIPLMEVYSPFLFDRSRLSWDGTKGMRSLTNQDFASVTSLHEAVLKFCERHVKKMQKHISSGGINGIANFMHIMLATLGVLHSQIERVMQSLDKRSTPLSPDEWYSYKKYFDIYFARVKGIVNDFVDQYTPVQNKLLKMSPDLV